jgi:hypothetical protein
MEINDQSLSNLNEIFVNILSPYNATRKAAEELLVSLELRPGFPLLVLALVNKLVQSTAPHDIAIRQSAAVFLKNLVKRKWEAADDVKDKN